MSETRFSLKDKVFLVVDDEDMLRDLIVMELEELGAICVQANNGLDAFQVLESETVDFILSDIRMPLGSGIDLLRLIHESKWAGRIPILMMSGFTDLSIDQSKDLGAFDMVSKPFLLSEIMPTIQMAFEAQSRQRVS